MHETKATAPELTFAEELAPPATAPQAPLRINMGQARTQPRRTLFLVLSIFIGIISGLLVVCFRVVIEWIKILGLGSAPHAGSIVCSSFP